MAEATAPLPRNPSTMLHGWILRAELQKLAASRRERAEPIDWAKWSYAAASTLDAIRPGRDRIVMMANGRPYEGRYFRTWGECLPKNFLCEGKNRLALTLDEVPDDVLRAAEAACRAVGKRRHRTFLKGKTIGRLLGVTSAERERLGLRIIGAVDVDKSKLKGATVERKRERDRLRDERKRREAGAKPRTESIAKKAREMGISPGALRVRLHRERVRCNGFLASTDSGPCNGFLAPTDAMKVIEKTAISPANSAHVTVSSPHKYEVSSLATSARPSDEPHESPSDGAEIGPAARPRARPGMAPDGGSICENSSPVDRRSIIPPPKPVTIDGFPAQVFHWIGCGAHEAAADLRRLAESEATAAPSGARPGMDAVSRVVDRRERDLIRRMEAYGSDDDAILDAAVEMDRRLCQLSSEARTEGAPMVDLMLLAGPPAPGNDARAMRT